jgi:hypothetical protein
MYVLNNKSSIKNNRMNFRFFLIIIVIFLLINLIDSNFQFSDTPILGDVSANSSWKQSTEIDFNTGTPDNVIIHPNSTVALDTKINDVEDYLNDFSNILNRTNVSMATPNDDFKLTKHVRTFGGGSDDSGRSVRPTSDGGFIIAAITDSKGAGNTDLWLIKTNSIGEHQWDKTFGVSGGDACVFAQQTSDGGYIIIGSTVGNVWLIKTNETGIEQWNKQFGGLHIDNPFSGFQLSDDGFIIIGETHSYSPDQSYTDVWLIRTDLNGNEIWNRTFGGKDNDRGYSVLQTADGGFLITGYTRSFGTGLPQENLWLIKTDSSGNETWNKTYGGK